VVACDKDITSTMGSARFGWASIGRASENISSRVNGDLKVFLSHSPPRRLNSRPNKMGATLRSGLARVLTADLRNAGFRSGADLAVVGQAKTLYTTP
jgi:hypothetical protein